MRTGALVSAALLLVCSVGFAADRPILPKPEKYFVDHSGVVPADRANAINEKLAQFERDSSNQVIVYIEPKIPDGTTLEDVANDSFHAWQIGQKEKSNGLVLFVFPDERQMRIEVGYGLEGKMPDSRSHRITSDVIKPHFKNGDIAGGIDAGVDEIIATLKGEYSGSGKTAHEASSFSNIPSSAIPILIIFAIVGIVVVITIVSMIIGAIRSIRRRGLVPASSPGYHSSGGWSSNDSSSSWNDSSSSSWSSSDSSSSWSSSDSSSSSSDFSSGGGDSGGGGSSDSW